MEFNDKPSLASHVRTAHSKRKLRETQDHSGRVFFPSILETSL